MIPVLGTWVFGITVLGTWVFGISVFGSSVSRYSVFGSSVSRYSCDGQVLMAYAAYVVIFVVRYAVYPLSTPARQLGGGVKCSWLNEE